MGIIRTLSAANNKTKKTKQNIKPNSKELKNKRKGQREKRKGGKKEKQEGHDLVKSPEVVWLQVQLDQGLQLSLRAQSFPASWLSFRLCLLPSSPVATSSPASGLSTSPQVNESFSPDSQAKPMESAML